MKKVEWYKTTEYKEKYPVILPLDSKYITGEVKKIPVKR